MMKHLLTCGLLMFFLSIGISYASVANNGIGVKQEARKQVCKTSEKLIPEKLIKIKPSSEREKSTSGTTAVAPKSPAAADTFESFIAPFLKTVAPVFYDQIIRRENKSSELRS